MPANLSGVVSASKRKNTASSDTAIENPLQFRRSNSGEQDGKEAGHIHSNTNQKVPSNWDAHAEELLGVLRAIDFKITRVLEHQVKHEEKEVKLKRTDRRTSTGSLHRFSSRPPNASEDMVATRGNSREDTICLNANSSDGGCETVVAPTSEFPEPPVAASLALALGPCGHVKWDRLEQEWLQREPTHPDIEASQPKHLEPREFLVPGEFESSEATRRHSKGTHGRMRTMTAHSHFGDIEGQRGCMRGCLPLHPDSMLRMVLDGLGMALLLTDTILVPYQVSWEKGLEGPLIYIAWITVLFWSCDIVSNFLTSFSKDDVLVMDFGQIAKQYAKSWMFPDLTVVCVDWIALILQLSTEGENTSDVNSYIKIVRFLKAFRLVRVLAVLRSGRFAQVQDAVLRRAAVLGVTLQIQFAMGIARLVFLIMWLNHIGACVWWVFVRNVTLSETGDSWSASLAEEVGLTSITLNQGKDGYFYLSGLYWSVTAMFSGASFRPPNNSAEAAFALVYIVFGMLFGSTLISSVAAMLVDFQMVTRDHNQKMRTLRKYLRQNGVPPLLAITVQTQVVERITAEKRLSAQDVPVLALLSTHLRNSLLYEINAPKITSEPLLMMCDGVDDMFIRDLCGSSALITKPVGPGHLLFQPSTALEQAYYLVGCRTLYTRHTSDSMPLYTSHTATMVSNNSEPVEVKSASWLADLALWTHWQTHGLAEAIDTGELMCVAVKGLTAVLNRHPDVGVIAEDYAVTLVTVIVNEMVALSDLTWEMNLNSDHLICAMPLDTRLQLSLPALRAVQAQAMHNSKRTKALAELEKEIREGKCYLTSNGHGSVLRVVNLITLRLERGDRRFLVEAGKWLVREGTVLRSKPKLPGTKTRAGEVGRQALERMLAEELSRFVLDVDNNCVQEAVEAASDSYGVATRYAKSNYKAAFVSETEMSDMETTPTSTSFAAQHAMSEGRLCVEYKDTCGIPLTMLEHVQAFSDLELVPGRRDYSCKDKVNLFAWVTEEEFFRLGQGDTSDLKYELVSSV